MDCSLPNAPIFCSRCLPVAFTLFILNVFVCVCVCVCVCACACVCVCACMCVCFCRNSASRALLCILKLFVSITLRDVELLQEAMVKEEWMCLYQITATQSQHGVVDCTGHVYIVHECRNTLFFLTDVQVCCKCEEADFLQILCFILPPLCFSLHL